MVIAEFQIEPKDGVEFVDRFLNGIDSADRQISIIMVTVNSEPSNISSAL